jgi:Fuc2NAc and GlcNAc transferase
MKSTLLLLGCLVSGAAGAWIVSARAVQWGLVDQPCGRSSHSHPTPRGGGIGILAAVLGAGVFLEMPWWFVLPPVVLGGLSFFDDKLSLSVSVRLVMQFFICGIMVFNLPWFSLQGGLGTVAVFLFLILYLVAATNFYNFMDGINGIAGITGVVFFLLMGSFAFIRGEMNTVGLFSLGMALACLGFLPFNIPGAKVFMGDVGSVTLGLVSAGLIAMMSRQMSDFLCLVSFLFLFYADTLTTLWLRWKAGEKLSQAHRRHLYQVLVNECGHAHWVVSLIYGFIQLIMGGLMLGAWYHGEPLLVTLLVVASMVFLFVNFRLRKAAGFLVN